MRVFISSASVDIKNKKAFIDNAGDMRHIKDVLRMRRGERLTLCDENGIEYECALANMSDKKADRLETDIFSFSPTKNEPRTKITLFTAMMKGERMDSLVMKSVEMGVFAIVPFLSSRCVSRPDGGQAEKKRLRLQKIAKNAAEQSERGRIPEIHDMLTFEQAVDRAIKADAAVFLYENERKTSLRETIKDAKYDAVSIMSGPEGGFDKHENDFALLKGLRPVSLGRRILRCETAPLCALAAVMYAAGEYGYEQT